MTEQRVSQLAARQLPPPREPSVAAAATPAVPDEAQIREWIQAELDTSISATLATLPSAADLDGIPEEEDGSGEPALRVGPLVRPAAEVAAGAGGDDDSSPPGDE
jgi:hypothetical protein